MVVTALASTAGPLAPGGHPVIDVRGVSCVYRTRDRLVVANDRIDLQIRRGEIFGLLGRNGAGKSTLVLQLMGLLSPTAGTIHIDDIEIARHPEEIKRRIGFLAQSGMAMRFINVERALRYIGCLRGQPPADARAQATEVMAELGLTEHAGRDVNVLSGGLMHLVSFGMALMGRPQVLILDEPTNELDPERRRLVWRLIDRLNRETGVTCVLVTHNMLEAEAVVHRVALMRSGRVLAVGTPGDLKQTLGSGVRLDFSLREGAALSDDERERLGKVGALVEEPAGRHRVLLTSEWLPGAAQVLGVILGPDRVDDFRIAPPSLEDVFFRVCGGERDDPRPPDDPPPPAVAGPPPAARSLPALGMLERWRRFRTAFTYLFLEQMFEMRTTWLWNGLFSLFMPLAMVFGLARIGAGLRDPESMLYILSGTLVFTVATEGISTMALRMGYMKREGMLLYYASLPIGRLPLVASVVSSRLLVTLPGLLAPIVASSLLYGYDVAVTPWVIVVLFLCCLSLATIGMALGLAIPTLELTVAITNTIIYVLLLGAPIFIPARSLPVPLRALSFALPPTYAADALRRAFTGATDAVFYLELLVLAALTALGLLVVQSWLRWQDVARRR